MFFGYAVMAYYSNFHIFILSNTLQAAFKGYAVVMLVLRSRTVFILIFKIKANIRIKRIKEAVQARCCYNIVPALFTFQIFKIIYTDNSLGIGIEAENSSFDFKTSKI